MKLNSRVTSGLAWAGLALVVGVPTLDFAVARMSGPASLSLSSGEGAASGQSEPLVLRSASVRRGADPVVTGSTGDIPKPIARSESALPDYISGEGEVEVAAVQPAPRRARDAAPAKSTESAQPELAVTPVEPRAEQRQAGGVETRKPVAESQQTASVEASPLIITPGRETAPAQASAGQLASSQPVGMTSGTGLGVQPEAESELALVVPAEELVAPIPLPRSARPSWTEGDFGAGEERDRDPRRVIRPEELEGQFASTDEFISAEELEEWESGPLSDFLEQRRTGRPDPGRRASRRSDDFDGDGFFLDEGPNRDRGGEDEFFIPFAN